MKRNEAMKRFLILQSVLAFICCSASSAQPAEENCVRLDLTTNHTRVYIMGYFLPSIPVSCFISVKLIEDQDIEDSDIGEKDTQQGDDTRQQAPTKTSPEGEP